MKAIAPQTMISTQAIEEIRAAILNGTLPAGSRIRQEDLAARLGVSREPVRKALIVLEQEGLILNVGNRGAIVAPLDLPLISEIYELRAALESYVAGKVAGQVGFDGAGLRKIIEQGRRAVRAASLDQMIELDMRFHTEIYRASGSRVVMEVMETQWGHMRRAMLMVLTAAGYRKQVWDEHENLLDAMVRKDVARARTLAAEHTQGAHEWVIGGLKRSFLAGEEKE